MRITKSARILSIVLAIAVFACCLPFALGGNMAITVSAEGETTVDYTTVAAATTPADVELPWYTDTLGMYDGAGLHSNGTTGLYPDADVIYKTEIDPYIEKVGPFAVYKIEANTAFSATFAEGTDLSKIDILVSDIGSTWYVVNPTVDGLTLSVKDLGSAVNYVKIQWPYDRSSTAMTNILSSVTYTKATEDTSVKTFNYGVIDCGTGYHPSSSTNVMTNITTKYSELSSKGFWDASNAYLNKTGSGGISASYDRLAAESGVDTYVVYNVQPGTRFSLWVDNVAENNSKKGTDKIALALGYTDPTEYTVQLFGAGDQFGTYEALNAEHTHAARVAGTGSILRSTLYSFIVPDGVTFIKCQFPQDGDVSKKVGTDAWAGRGNDIIFIQKVEYTPAQAELDYGKTTYDTYDGYNADNTGINATSNITFSSGNGYAPTYISTTYANGGKNDPSVVAYVSYKDIVPGTAFNARFYTGTWWGGIIAWLNKWANDTSATKVFDSSVGYEVKLQGYDYETKTWVTVDKFNFVLDDPSVASGTVAAANQKYYEYLCVSAEDNVYDQLRITWPYVGDNSHSGNNFAFLEQVFMNQGDKVIDFTNQTSTSTGATALQAVEEAELYSDGVLDWNSANSPIPTANGLQARYSVLNGKTGLSKWYVTLDARDADIAYLDFYRTSWPDKSDIYKNYDVTIYTSATPDFAEYETFAPNIDIKYEGTTVQNGTYVYKAVINMPEGHDYIKVEYPQTGSQDASTDFAGNDQFGLKTVRLVGCNETEYIGNYYQLATTKGVTFTSSQNINSTGSGEAGDWNTVLGINAVAYNGNHVPAVNHVAGIQANYAALYNKTDEAPAEKCWFVLDTSMGSRVELLVQPNTNVPYDYYAAPVVYTSSTTDFTDAVGTTVNVGTYTTLDIPAGHNYLKFEFQQTHKNMENNAAGNDYYNLRYIRIIGDNENVATTSTMDEIEVNATSMDTPVYVPLTADNINAYYTVTNTDKVYRVTFEYTNSIAESEFPGEVSLVASSGATINADSFVSEATSLNPATTDTGTLYYQSSDATSGNVYDVDTNKYLMLQVQNAGAVTITNVVIEEMDYNTTAQAGTASALTDAVASAQNKQAIRFYAQYQGIADETGAYILVDSSAYTITERGMLIRGYNAANTEAMTVASPATQALKLSKTSGFGDAYWSYDNGIYTYSNYVDGFALDATASIEIRAYVKATDSVGNTFVFYSNHYATSVADLIAGGSTTEETSKAPSAN